jgi:hypothetical protein
VGAPQIFGCTTFCKLKQRLLRPPLKKHTPHQKMARTAKDLPPRSSPLPPPNFSDILLSSLTNPMATSTTPKSDGHFISIDDFIRTRDSGKSKFTSLPLHFPSDDFNHDASYVVFINNTSAFRPESRYQISLQLPRLFSYYIARQTRCRTIRVAVSSAQRVTRSFC